MVNVTPILLLRFCGDKSGKIYIFLLTLLLLYIKIIMNNFVSKSVPFDNSFGRLFLDNILGGK